uniref:dolichyl-P-Man:Man5GlcNAc2-PP-dolichol alpha-1,3-mannosyltransferase n=1 Tax=Cyclophora tenuis TaxID=216820 RepID=A0A7S1GPB1_CYCTE
MALVCLSKRLHSIYVLRLFNDGPAMLLLFASICCMIRNSWKWGCFLFSLAVSIKMNILLFAPGLLLLLLQAHTTLWGTVECLTICAVTQLILGAPFLLRYPESYLRKAFELDRVFFYKWTVNWKFLSEDVFVSKQLSLVLLACHLGALAYFAIQLLKVAKQRVGHRIFWPSSSTMSPEYILYTMFLSNFIGICFARTLHYQFYCWYISTIPMLLLLTTSTTTTTTTATIMTKAIAMVLVMVALEYSFHIFPATPLSSAVLQITHGYILVQCISNQFPAELLTTPKATTVVAEEKRSSKDNAVTKND